MLYTVNNLTVVYTINNCLIAQCTVLISLYMPPPHFPMLPEYVIFAMPRACFLFFYHFKIFIFKD